MSELEKVDPQARLSIQQAAAFLGCSRRTVYNHAERGLLHIEHDDRGRPYIRRGVIDGFLASRDAGVKKTQYVPDGHIVIKEEAWHQTRQIAEQMTTRAAELGRRVEHLLTYERQAAEDQSKIEALEAERQALAGELERLRRRSWLERLLNR